MGDWQGSAASIEVSRLRAIDDVIEIAAECAEAGDAASLQLDLRGLSSGSPAGDRGRRIPQDMVLLLSNLVLTRLRQRDLAVHLPETPSLRTQLARGGLLFAMANHPRMDPASWHTLESAQRRWSTDWQARDRQLRLRLFGSEDEVDEEVATSLDSAHAELASFLNIHRPPRDRVRAELSPNQVQPWLRRHVGDYVPPSERSRFEGLLSDVSEVVDQLLDNIRDHAELSPADNSFVQVATTRGAQTTAHVVAFDTGLGILTTAAKRAPESDDAGSSVSLLTRALMGQLPRYARSRARGLAIVTELVSAYGGQLFLATSAGTDLADDAALIATHDGREDPPAPRVEEVLGLPIEGTILHVQLPARLRSGPEAAASPQLAGAGSSG